MVEASFYTREADNRVRCGLCRFYCLIADGDRGICRVRENRGGTLYSLVYGRLCAEQVDPIEKKPLYHLLPGSRSFSIATVGCNFRCEHCQNYPISQLERQATISGSPRTPVEVVAATLASGSRSIAYTYTEPTIFYEFARDTARLAREAGLKNVFVTNGYISRAPLAEIAPYLDAANIDLKGFSAEFYRDIVHARLSEVLDSILAYREEGVWIELTTLLIPGLNDGENELRRLADFIVTRLGSETPWHVSAFYPTYRLLDRPRTPLATLRRAREIGLAAGLRYVYEGNVPGGEGEQTTCPACRSVLIDRRNLTLLSNRLRHNACPDCGAAIAGVWE